MTRNQWFAELSRLLSVLPKEEAAKARDYYNELYADKQEAGASEEEILREFGRPYDVSREIISAFLQENPGYSIPDYDRGTGYAKTEAKKERPPYSPPSRPASSKNTSSDDGNRVLWIILCIIFAIPVGCLYIAMAALAFGLWCGVFALIASGVIVPIVSIVTEPLSAGAILSVLGIGLILVAVGIFFGTLVEFIVKYMFKGVNTFLTFLKKSIAGA
ncbi:MAG: DUF1700 domain-containing protein [Clostridia bacterium]|nr:DUF1700 domain-containing protein [Clostridia bacterium]